MMKFNKDSEEGDINVKSFYMGSRYAVAFAKGLQNNKTVKQINISRNNLKDKGAISIIDSIQDNVESIDMSNNTKLTSSSYQRLALFLDDPYKRYLLQSHLYRLTSLSLEGNEVQDSYLRLM